MTKVLQASHLALKPIFQMIVLQEVVNWFDQPHLVLEMFVNYDLDSKFESHWNVFSYLVRAVCAIARRTSNNIKAWNWRPGTSSLMDTNVRELHMYALEEVARVARTLMDATGHAFLLNHDSQFRSRNLGNGLGWEEDDRTPSSPHGQNGERSPSLSSASNSGKSRTTSTRLESVKYRRANHQKSEELISEAVKIYREKDSIKKAVQFLISKVNVP